MKKTIYIAGIFLLTLSACRSTRTTQQTIQASDDYAQEEVTYQTFYDGLSPYGNWIDYPGIGYAWTPSETGFRPYYSNGYWAYSTMGWTWVSSYQWGWAAFHYGRWFNDPFYGWVWAPGYEWAPAWVSWRGNNDMYGWAPLAPSGYGGYNNIPYNHWAFVPCQHINDHNGYQYYQQGSQVYINNTTIINNYNPVVRGPRNPRAPGISNANNNYAAGPAIRDVERITKNPVTPMQIRGTRTPGREEVTGNSINIYKPSVKSQQANNADANAIRPTNVMPYKKEPAVQANPAIRNENNQPQQPLKRDEIKQPDPRMNEPQLGNNKSPQPNINQDKMPVTKEPVPPVKQPVQDNNNDKNNPPRPRPVQQQPRETPPVMSRENKQPVPPNNTPRPPVVKPVQNTPAPQRQAPVQRQPVSTPAPVYRRPAANPGPPSNTPRQNNMERNNNKSRSNNPPPAQKRPN